MIEFHNALTPAVAVYTSTAVVELEQTIYIYGIQHPASVSNKYDEYVCSVPAAAVHYQVSGTAAAAAVVLVILNSATSSMLAATPAYSRVVTWPVDSMRRGSN